MYNLIPNKYIIEERKNVELLSMLNTHSRHACWDIYINIYIKTFNICSGLQMQLVVPSAIGPDWTPGHLEWDSQFILK